MAAQRQNPAYRPAKERPRSGGVFLLVRGRSDGGSVCRTPGGCSDCQYPTVISSPSKALRSRSARVRLIDVPLPARSSQQLAQHDYEDAYEIAAPAAEAVSAEQWARSVFEGAVALAPLLHLGWSLYCRLDLAARGSRGAVLGWRIVDRTPEVVVLDADGSSVHAQLVIWTTSSTLNFSTFVHYKNRGGRLLFTSIKALHRRLVPYLLKRAVNAVESTE
jgi:hypothetical protein